MKYELDPTVSDVLNNQIYEENVELPLENPTNVLSQQKSDITTNPYIISTKSIKEEEQQHVNPKFSEINSNLSYSVLGLFDDLFVKPDNEYWKDYIPMILSKDDRYNYLGVFLLLIAFYILLIK